MHLLCGCAVRTFFLYSPPRLAQWELGLGRGTKLCDV